MDIDRRDFLKHFTVTVAAISGLKSLWTLTGNTNSLPSLAAQALDICREYSATNFAGWEVILGDALHACPGELPVTMNDIKTIHENAYSELQANIMRRCIMAHNITFTRIIDDRAFDFVHCARYEFRLPFLPVADFNAQENGQTIEGGLFIWDGKGTRFDYGMGFQITLNPWRNLGDLSIWSTDESSKGKWEVVGKLQPDTEWHLVEMTVDFQQKEALLVIDDTEYPARFTKTKKPDYWEQETAARFQAEIVSIWPEPVSIKALHRVQFRDWNWAWKSESCHEAYLPAVMKQPAPTPTSCAGAQIISPSANSEVPISSPVTVRWAPDSCLMVLQYYQDGALRGEYKNAPSGASIQIAAPGRTELKIWQPGSYLPADNIWVDVI